MGYRGYSRVAAVLGFTGLGNFLGDFGGLCKVVLCSLVGWGLCEVLVGCSVGNALLCWFDCMVYGGFGSCACHRC